MIQTLTHPATAASSAVLQAPVRKLLAALTGDAQWNHLEVSFEMRLLLTQITSCPELLQSALEELAQLEGPPEQALWPE